MVQTGNLFDFRFRKFMSCWRQLSNSQKHMKMYPHPGGHYVPWAQSVAFDEAHTDSPLRLFDPACSFSDESRQYFNPNGGGRWISNNGQWCYVASPPTIPQQQPSAHMFATAGHPMPQTHMHCNSGPFSSTGSDARSSAAHTAGPASAIPPSTPQATDDQPHPRSASICQTCAAHHTFCLTFFHLDSCSF